MESTAFLFFSVLWAERNGGGLNACPSLLSAVTGGLIFSPCRSLWLYDRGAGKFACSTDNKRPRACQNRWRSVTVPTQCCLLPAWPPDLTACLLSQAGRRWGRNRSSPPRTPPSTIQDPWNKFDTNTIIPFSRTPPRINNLPQNMTSSLAPSCKKGLFWRPPSLRVLRNSRAGLFTRQDNDAGGVTAANFPALLLRQIGKTWSCGQFRCPYLFRSTNLQDVRKSEWEDILVWVDTLSETVSTSATRTKMSVVKGKWMYTIKWPVRHTRYCLLPLHVISFLYFILGIFGTDAYLGRKNWRITFGWNVFFFTFTFKSMFLLLYSCKALWIALCMKCAM